MRFCCAERVAPVPIEVAIEPVFLERAPKPIGPLCVQIDNRLAPALPAESRDGGMFGPSWDEGCPSCSAGPDEVSASLLEHLHVRDGTHTLHTPRGEFTLPGISLRSYIERVCTNLDPHALADCCCRALTR